MDDITKTFHKLMDQLNEQTKKAPEQDPHLRSFDNLINADRALLVDYQLYQGHLRSLKRN